MAFSGVRSSWLICARKRDFAILAAFGAPARLVGNGLGLLQFADQRVLLGARLRVASADVEAMGQQGNSPAP
jgi:hypothetical protein